MHRSLPTLDDALRRRLVARYGDEVEAWLEDLPSTLIDLAGRWSVEYTALVPRGSMSAVLRCVLADGRPAVLKVCPNRKRITDEAAALERWTTEHVPVVHAVDTDAGALLMEQIVPGTTLVESRRYPADAVAELVQSLHAHGHPDPAYQRLAERVAYLFDASTRHRERHPELIEAVPAGLVDRGRRMAEQ